MCLRVQVSENGEPYDDFELKYQHVLFDIESLREIDPNIWSVQLITASDKSIGFDTFIIDNDWEVMIPFYPNSGEKDSENYLRGKLPRKYKITSVYLGER
jgi:hypothetical protein